MRSGRTLIAGVIAMSLVLVPGVAFASVDVNFHTLEHRQRDGELMLKAAGTLEPFGGAPEQCFENRKVIIERRREKGRPWRKVGSDMTNSEGNFSTFLDHMQGQFRALVEVIVEFCPAEKSARRTHRH